MGGEVVGSTASSFPRNPQPRNPFSSASSKFSQPLCWSVPTRIEVETAIAALQSFMRGFVSARSASNELQPNLSRVEPRLLQSPGFQRVCDAFYLLQTVPSIQRMVASIASDRAIWDAVLNNNEVQKFQQSVKQARLCRAQGAPKEEPDFISMILSWILDNMKLKVVELIDVLKALLSNTSDSPRKDNSSSPERKQQFEEMICSTALLSIITLMIVLVSRAYGS